jgi:hypothetical protein
MGVGVVSWSMRNKNSRKQQLLRQYFLNAYSIALLKQAGDVVSKAPDGVDSREATNLVPQAS